MAGPDWFKMSAQNDAIVFALSDEQAGRVFKASFWYFRTGEVAALDPAENIAFAALKRDMDLSKKAYAERCEKNRENARKRWDKNDEK